MEDVESIYGAPKDRYEADTSVQFTYEYGLYQTITLGFDNETGILYSLDMQNLRPRLMQKRSMVSAMPQHRKWSLPGTGSRQQ